MSSRFIHIVSVFIIFLLWTSCAITTQIKNGEMAYDRKQYAVAIDMLEEEYEATRDKSNQARKAYLLGKSYSFLGNTDQAVSWMEKAFAKGYGPEVTQDLAYQYKKAGKYEAAIRKYEQLKTEVIGRDQEINREISVIEQMKRWTTDDEYEYNIKLSRLSSSYSDFAPVIFEDEYLIYTSDREGSLSDDQYKWTGVPHSDLYITPKNSSSPQRFDSMINSNENDGTAAFSSDYQEIYFTRCYSENDVDDAHCKIMYSDRYTEIWKEPIVLPFTQDGVNYGQPTLIENDSVLVFSTDLEGGLGKHDLFYSIKIALDDGGHEWSIPEPMPPSINTPGDELFPVGYGDTLYFSSDYLPGYGGLDIFMTFLRSDGSWAPPKNLKTPINSPSDDYSYIKDPTARMRGKQVEKGFFASNRDGYGSDDIYMFTKLKKNAVEPDPIEPPTEIDTAEYIVNLVLKTQTPLYTDEGDPNSEKTGHNLLPDVNVQILDGADVMNLKTDADGLLIVEVDVKKNYTIKAEKNGYFSTKSTVSTMNLDFKEGEFSATINKSLNLDKIYYDKEIVLDNIYYDFNKWNIREDAKPVLDSLSLILLENKGLTIELSSHTDCRGDDEYNMILSQKRAQSVTDYLVTLGINARTLTARGYGETTPVINCDCDTCTEDMHQQNRRTSFKILQD